MTPKTSGLRAQRPRARTHRKVPAYPALLCLAIAGMTVACADDAWPDEPADAQTADPEDASDGEPSEPDAASADDAGEGDDLQVAGCSATMYRAGPRDTWPSAAVIAGLIAVGAGYRRRRSAG